MRLSRIHISNFRNFSNFEITLGKNAIIIGQNNAGKSNLLHALRLVLDPSLPDSERSLDSDDFWEGLEPAFGGSTIEISIDLTDFDNNSAVMSVLSDALLVLAPMAVARITFSYRPRDTIDLNLIPLEQLRREHYTDIIFARDEPTHRLPSEFRKWIPLQVLPALRDASSDLNSWQRSPLRPLIENLKEKIDQEKLKEVAKKIDDATKELLAEPNIHMLEQSILGRLSDMVGQTEEVDPRLGFLETDAERLLRSLRLFADGEKLRSLDEIGLGYSNIIYLVLLMLDLERREKITEERAATIVAIEEPEAHLHPHLQRLVFGDLLRRSDAISILLTTHSPHIASVSNLEDYVLLKQTNSGTNGWTIHQAGLSDQEKLDIKRYIDVTRAEFLFCKGVILVEGPVELFLVPVFADKLAQKLGVATLDVRGITISSVYGTNFEPYVKFLGYQGFDIPLCVITDGDYRFSKRLNAYYYDGIKRGKHMAQFMSANIADIRHLDPYSLGDANALRTALNSHRVFVGFQTLEADLLDTGCQHEFIDTFIELGASGRKLVNIQNLLNDWGSIPPQDKLKKITKAIESVGDKGRFAQRLANKLTVDRIPAHIDAALRTVLL